MKYIFTFLIFIGLSSSAFANTASGIGRLTCKEATLFVEENGSDGFKQQLFDYYHGFKNGKESSEKGEVEVKVSVSIEQPFYFVMNKCYQQENKDKVLTWILKTFYEQLETQFIVKGTKQIH